MERLPMAKVKQWFLNKSRPLRLTSPQQQSGWFFLWLRLVVAKNQAE